MYVLAAGPRFQLKQGAVGDLIILSSPEAVARARCPQLVLL